LADPIAGCARGPNFGLRLSGRDLRLCSRRASAGRIAAHGWSDIRSRTVPSDVIPDSTGLHVAGLDGSGYTEANLGRFVDTWGTVLKQTEAQVTREPDQPGLVRSIYNLVSAILRTAAGMAGGLIRGAISGL
jgi:hypothetical protein